MDKYRKLYNDNFLGTSDISILKFYYASFKIQQSKGKATDVTQFLDSCVKISYDTSFILKIFSVLPFINVWLGTGKEQKRIADIIVSKRENIEQLFLQDDISDDDILHVLYGLPQSIKTELTPTITEQIDLAKEYILKCYSIKGRKQLGDRIFGYLLKAEIIKAYTPQERLSAWYQLVGYDIKPSNVKLHANPKLSRSNFGKDSLSLTEQLETICSFLHDIDLKSAADIVRKDITNIVR